MQAGRISSSSRTKTPCRRRGGPLPPPFDHPTPRQRRPSRLAVAPADGRQPVGDRTQRRMGRGRRGVTRRSRFACQPSNLGRLTHALFSSYGASSHASQSRSNSVQTAPTLSGRLDRSPSSAVARSARSQPSSSVSPRRHPRPSTGALRVDEHRLSARRTRCSCRQSWDGRPTQRS